MSHEALVLFSKTFGLLWMMGFFLVAAAVAYWPGRRARYERAARSILPDADREGPR